MGISDTFKFFQENDPEHESPTMREFAVYLFYN